MNKLQKTDKANNGQKVALAADFGTMYIRVKGNEIMRPIRADMALYEKAGHFFKMKDDYPISYQGYKQLNKIASISIVTPQKVMIDERERVNPHIERNPKTKMIETVSIRKIGIGYSPAGNITVVDKTLFYNIYAYFIESIQSKMKRVVWKNGKPTDVKLHPDCAVIGTENDKPNKDGTWAFYETVSPLGIWINADDPAIIDCLNEHTQRQKFGDRIAQTIVERNILKDHPGIGVGKVQPQGTATKGNNRAYVTVYGYRHESGYPQVKTLMEQAERGDEAIDIHAEVIEEIEPEVEAQVIEEEKTGEPKKAEKKAKKDEQEKTPAEMDEPPDDYELTQEEDQEHGQ